MKAPNLQRNQTISHPFAPVFDAQSKVLVLGSFPSVKSRETEFYYGHPQNRFWRLLASLFHEPLPKMIAEKTALLSMHHIALWDVVFRCTIEGSADSTLKPQKFNDIASLIQKTDIHTVFCNGQTAGKLYKAKWDKTIALPMAVLPSTSPANAAWTLDRLKVRWQALKDSAERA